MVIDIKRDNIFLDNIIPKITNCYFRFYLPEISQNRKLENKPAFYFNEDFFNKNIKNNKNFYLCDLIKGESEP